LLHYDGEHVITLGVFVVLLAAGKSVLETFKGNGEHADIVDLEYASERLDQALLDKNVVLLGVSGRSAIGECPHCLLLDEHVVVLKNVYESLDDAEVDADLEVLLSACGDVRKNPA